VRDDLLRFRDRFPILSEKTYLASHSLGAVPKATEDALREYYREWAKLGIQAWSGPWWEAMEAFSRDIERVLGAPAETVAPMLNVTRAMAAVASCFDWSGERNKVVTTAMEFSTTRPFLTGLERLGAELVVVPSEDGMRVDAGRVAEQIDERTRLVVSSHVFFRSGAMMDLRRLAKAAREKGAYLLGDGYQTAGCVPIDVQDLGVDFYTSGCHKWLCGGPGAGFLYVRKELIPELRPALTGWFGLQDPFAYDPGPGGFEPSAGIHRFLAGTTNIPGFYAAREGVRAVLEAGIENIRERSMALTGRVVEMASERGIEIRSPLEPSERSGMVCLQFEGSEEATAALVEGGVIVDWRPDCGLRVSPHFYNTEDELGVFFERLDAVREKTGV
jgi:kynureninase